MQLNRTKNTIRNTAWGICQKTVNILGPFVVRTILIFRLSSEYAGLNSLFTSILSILSLSELGFSNAIVYSMYKPVAQDDKDKICAYLNIYRRAYRYIGLVILSIGLLITPFIRFMIKGNVPADINLYILYLMYLFNTVISYFLFAYKTSLLSVYQREDVVSRNTIISNLLLYMLQIVALIAFGSYYMYTLLIPVATVVLNLINSREVDRLFPDYKPYGTITSEEKKELKKNLAGIMIWKVGGASRNALDSVVISIYIGLTTVAIYDNYMYVIGGVIAFLGVIVNSMTAGIGNKIENASVEANYTDFKKFQFMYLWIASWCAVCMLCLYQPFMRLWMGEKLMLPTYMVPLFVYYFWMMKQGDINSAYYQAAGLWWYGKWRSVFEAVINLSLNLILGYFFGVMGILLATIIAYLAVNVYGSSIIYTQYFKNHSFWGFWKENIKFLSVTILSGWISYIICSYIKSILISQLLIQLICNLVVCIVIPNIFFFLLLHNDESFNISKDFVRHIFDRSKKDV